MTSTRHILITGGSRGIGLAVAEHLVAQGVHVCITGRNSATLAHVQERLGCLVRVCDSHNPLQLATLAQDLRSQWGGLEGLVVNAGVARRRTLGSTSATELQEDLMDNFAGPFHTLQVFAPLLQDDASVVLLSSIAGNAPMPQLATYGPLKAALKSLAGIAARQWAPRGIRVNCVSPGAVATADYGATLGLDPEAITSLMATIRAATPLQRMGQPEEMAKAIGFLLSKDASFITGVDLVIDGGRLLTTL